jgi:hypothetical protein
MSAFDDDLKALFAAEPEPVDDGFAAMLTRRVERRERVLGLLSLAGYAATALAVFAVILTLYWVMQGLMPSVGQVKFATWSPMVTALSLGPVLVAAGVAAAALSYARARQ